MYGMVNNAIKQLIIENHGQETWARVFQDSNLSSDDFYHMEQYEDSDSVALVVSASTILEMTPPAFLESLGIYWITYAMNSDYGDLLEMAGDSLVEVLENLDSMHGRVGDSFEALRPPSFWCTDVQDNSLHLHYASEREGLSPMVVGLIKGLGLHFGLDCKVENIASVTDGADHDIFSVTYTSMPNDLSQSEVTIETAA